MGYAKTWRFVTLPWTNDGDAMTPLSKAVDEPAQRHGDAVDFRGVCFRY